MAKGWDTFAGNKEYAEWVEQWARECLRVLKPGGHLLAFSGTRTYHALAWGVESAGFEIRDMVEWLYLSGFPKSMDVGKQFDRQRNEDLPYIYGVTKFITAQRDKANKTNKEIDTLFGLNGMAGHWTSQSSQPQVPKWEQWQMLKEFLSMPDDMDDEVWRLNGRKGKPGDAFYEREKVGEKETKDFAHHKGSMMSKETTDDWATHTTTIDITAPATPLAQQWDGWGTALKPAHEPIVMARKPLSGTVCANVEQYGTGAINVDGCRIETDDGVNRSRPPRTQNEIYGGGKGTNTTASEHNELGRFPANCITTDDDEWYSKYFNVGSVANVTPQDVSKKASKSDRNSTWDGQSINVEERVTTDGRQKPIDNPFNRGETLRQNHHPTVKPVALMEWLITLVTPPNGIVVDPFAGSGTTLVAAKRKGFRYIGIEREIEYVDIANQRLA